MGDIWPSGEVNQYLTIATMLPSNGWIGSNPGGRVYNYLSKTAYWPLDPDVGYQDWKPAWAYYFRMNGSVTWQLNNKPLLAPVTVTMEPKDAWSTDLPMPDGSLMRWFFLGYPTIGYMKLASLPSPTSPPTNGNPANFDYEGPFHWLIWHHEPGQQQYQPWDLKAIRTDDGKYYLPNPLDPAHPLDQIGMLQPGRGYFLGFYCRPNSTYDHTWLLNPTWTNLIQSIEPGSNPLSHFQFKSYTHWCYAVVIDTVDLVQTPMEAGDEIAAFDGDLCVGAVPYTESFPLLLNTWQDDIATPDTLDGFIVGHEMTFKWYDASENTEAEFILPPQTMAVDDPIIPTHSGFGIGAYASRNFSNGVERMQYLPKEFKLGQNYPNPFNSTTVIPLELPQRSKIRIEIYNLKGQRVGNVYDSVENAGYPKVYYDASRLASGVYFCRVTAEGLEREGKFSSVSKMVVLK